jgi:hypothetical protein
MDRKTIFNAEFIKAGISFSSTLRDADNCGPLQHLQSRDTTKTL